MRFRNWFESEEESGGPWAQEHPWLTRLGKVDYNKSQVNVFVEAMADKDKNAAGVYQQLTTRKLYKESNPRYNAPIANNLLIHNDLRLKNAVGVVETGIGKSNFRFNFRGENAGSISISHPPVIYDELDKIAMFGVIIHELAHAAHWSKDKRFKGAKIKYGFNSPKYTKHWTECYGYSQQLIALLEHIPDRESILSAFSQPSGQNPFDYEGNRHVYQKNSPFTLTPTLLEFAKTFLYHYQGRNEGILSKIAAPLITAASMLNPQPMLQPQAQPVMQQQVVSQKYEAANLIKQIVQKMLLRNFLIQV
jgi:hypothetical protein